jgi:hypothetical protein
MEMSMEQRGGVWRRQSVKDLQSAWIKAGCPEHFKMRYVKGKGAFRVWDLESQKEALEDRQYPGRAKVRKARGMLSVRRREIKRL